MSDPRPEPRRDLSRTATIRRIAATDLKFRFRRTTALVTLLVIAASVYLIVPDIRSGSTLMEIGSQRVLYNSAAIAMGTGMFCSILLTLFGYYLIGNSFRRDILAQTGYIIAGTRVKNFDYVAGKFLGATGYLTAVMLACMTSSMLMFLLRGEGPLQPGVFISTYCWLVLPGLCLAAGFAILFESVRFLSGRAGDVVYFFVWALMLSLPAVILDQKGGEAHINEAPAWLGLVDLSGLALIIKQVWEQFHTTSLSIGSSSFDPSKPPIVFEGLNWSASVLLSRSMMFILPLAMAGAGSLAFHRFDPTRVKMSAKQSKRNVFGFINNLLKPATRMLQPIAGSGTPGTFFSIVKADAVATLVLTPISIAACVMLNLVSLVVDGGTLQHGLIPLIVVVLVMILADCATRDEASGMTGLLRTVPRVRPLYVVWKSSAALLIASLFTIIPAGRLAMIDPASTVSLAIGTILIAISSVSFGVLSRTPKTSMAIFLMLLYIALNSKLDPGFDFAGFNGCATAPVRFMYAGITVALALAAEAWYRRGLRAT